MNAKYALALILTLQVSMCLGEIPAPSQEVVNTYNTLKSTFYSRLLNAYKKLQAVIEPTLEKLAESNRGQATRDYIEEVQQKPEFKAFVKIASGLGTEAAPLVDKARTSLLGLYEYYVRPHFGKYVQDSIAAAKVHLDRVLPVE
uniref:Uncharacterized protein n=2 Tax=Anabas testudineus TaxID=64144 RepID=A0A3Q1I384_ANATE